MHVLRRLAVGMLIAMHAAAAAATAAAAACPTRRLDPGRARFAPEICAPPCCDQGSKRQAAAARCNSTTWSRLCGGPGLPQGLLEGARAGEDADALLLLPCEFALAAARHPGPAVHSSPCLRVALWIQPIAPSRIGEMAHWGWELLLGHRSIIDPELLLLLLDLSPTRRGVPTSRAPVVVMLRVDRACRMCPCYSARCRHVVVSPQSWPNPRQIAQLRPCGFCRAARAAEASRRAPRCCEQHAGV